MHFITSSKLFRYTWVNKFTFIFLTWSVNGKTKQHRQIRCSGFFRLFRCSGVFQCSGVPVFLVLVHADFRNSENEHFASIANRLVGYINDVILTWRLGTKPTNCCKHKMAVAFINPSMDPGSPLTVRTCICAENCPESFYKPFKRILHD